MRLLPWVVWRFKAAYRVFLVSVAVYAALLIICPVVVFVAHAQQGERVQRLFDERDEVQRRIKELEGLNLDHRLTVIETLLREQEGGNRWAFWSSGGVGLLLFEALFRHGIARKVRRNSNE